MSRLNPYIQSLRLMVTILIGIKIQLERAIHLAEVMEKEEPVEEETDSSD